MKHFFTLITTLVFAGGLFAQSAQDERRGFTNHGRITISSLSNNAIKIVIDGKNYSNTGNDNEVMLNNVRAGYHTIKIYQQKSDRSNRKYNRNMQLVYDATIQVRSKYHIDIIINRFGKTFVDERLMNAAYYAQYDQENEQDNWNDNKAEVMSNYSFNQFRESLRNENFDNTRMTVAQQTIDANYFSAVQVKELMSLFSFEENKLEIAKYAYRNTVDKQNYFLVNEGFNYSTSKEQLARYIREFK